MQEIEKRGTMGIKKTGIGWALGGGVALFGSPLLAIGAVVAVIACVILFEKGLWLALGTTMGVGMMLLFKPLIVTALLVGALVVVIATVTALFLGSKAASPPSNR